MNASQPDMICEAHPTLEWPHDDCAGPGMPPINDPLQLAWAIAHAHIATADRTEGAYSPDWWATDRANKTRVNEAAVEGAQEREA